MGTEHLSSENEEINPHPLSNEEVNRRFDEIVALYDSTEAEEPHYERVLAPSRNAFEGREKNLHITRAEKASSGQMVPATPQENITNEFPEYLAKTRAQLLEGLESKEHDINLERVRNFLQELGLRTDTKLVILDPDDFDKFRERQVQLSGRSLRENGGCYVPGLNFIVLLRDPELEAQYGPEIFEYTAVHELVHSSADEEVFGYSTTSEGSNTQIDTHLSRSGQVIVNPNNPEHQQGLYLEEAFADKIGHLYIRDVLKRPDGFAQSDEPVAIDSDEGVIEVPPQYFLGEAGGKQSLAVLGLDYLLTKDPTLFDSLLKSRHSVDGLREVAAKINAIGKNTSHARLYKQLRSTASDWEDFASTTRTIIEATDPQATRQWDELYDDYEDYYDEDDGEQHPQDLPAIAASYDQYASPAGKRVLEIDNQIARFTRSTFGRELTPEENTTRAKLEKQWEEAIRTFNEQQQKS